MQSICQATMDEWRAKPTDMNVLVNAMLHQKGPKTGGLLSENNIMNTMILSLFTGRIAISQYTSVFITHSL